MQSGIIAIFKPDKIKYHQAAGQPKGQAKNVDE
jgi:hypothetical protein